MDVEQQLQASEGQRLAHQSRCVVRAQPDSGRGDEWQRADRPLAATEDAEPRALQVLLEAWGLQRGPSGVLPREEEENRQELEALREAAMKPQAQRK